MELIGFLLGALIAGAAGKLFGLFGCACTIGLFIVYQAAKSIMRHRRY